ncbi:hypothetical protein RRG08_052257 [Elysia crispata]|uniref:Uncharacterized protein n=1 Tax=Elysia crispata TaxID=231223 RepID=A0AAE0XED3_9GAST|nr:hypothetical protein RRG08_052257 [Elysia crispata]
MPPVIWAVIQVIGVPYVYTAQTTPATMLLVLVTWAVIQATLVPYVRWLPHGMEKLKTWMVTFKVTFLGLFSAAVAFITLAVVAISVFVYRRQ